MRPVLVQYRLEAIQHAGFTRWIGQSTPPHQQQLHTSSPELTSYVFSFNFATKKMAGEQKKKKLTDHPFLRLFSLQ